jgi:hypothetical protein
VPQFPRCGPVELSQRQISADPSCTTSRSLAVAGLDGVDGKDDVAGLLLGLDVPGRICHLLQRVPPVDYRMVLARLAPVM